MDLRAKISLIQSELDSLPKISESDRNAAFDAQNKEEKARQELDDILASRTEIGQQLDKLVSGCKNCFQVKKYEYIKY